ncbi:MCE family protein [Pseudonocardia sp. DSM 110487]|uniref:MCE family protein n=1 Tax=Pseudonocardia sp. DSM 110487 TaxID=2865833 RepID=UPI001C696CE9|nr:MCE family protein [Pseudonocardia sp. DSM 110487]QYN35122.1 MCE family protein [Pseudonocardia sp. DSM 110487]
MTRFPVGPLVKFLSLAVVVALCTTVLALTIANASGGARTTYTARFTDASGLLPGDDVRIAGVIVGSVDDVRIVDRRFAEVAFSVAQDQPLPASVGASILYRNLIGQRYLALEQGPGPTGETLPDGGTIPVERTRPPLNLTVLFNGFKPLLTALDPEQVNQLSFEIIQVLQGQGGTVKSLLAHTASLTNTLADRDEVIGQVIDNLNAVLETVNARDGQLSELISSLQALVSGLAEDREPIGEAIVSIGELTHVTAGFLEDARPPLKDDIGHLGDLAENLNAQDERLEQTIKNLPPKLKKVIRAGSYGSWFNFYLCGASGKVGLSPYIQPFEIPVFTSGQPRCGSDPDGGDSGNTDSLAGLPLPDLPLPELPLPGGDSGVPDLPAPDLPLLPDLSLGGS